MQVFRPTLEGRLARVMELTAEDGDLLTTPLLPGCQIDVRELFRTHIEFVARSRSTRRASVPADVLTTSLLPGCQTDLREVFLPGRVHRVWSKTSAYQCAYDALDDEFRLAGAGDRHAPEQHVRA